MIQPDNHQPASSHGTHRFAMFMDMHQQPALVVGGGNIAARKILRLLDAGAQVRVIAPDLNKSLAQLVNQHAIEHVNRDFVSDDVKNARLVIAATDQKNINALVAQSAHDLGIPVNVSDDPSAGNFIIPSLVDRSPLLIAVSTGGASPVLSRILAARIEAFIPAAYKDLAELAGRYRAQVQSSIKDARQRLRFWENLLSGKIGEKVLQGRLNEAEKQMQQAVKSPDLSSLQGEVYLVGAGPGDPDLLSFRALRLMQQADVVLYDRLVSDRILALIRRDATRIYVGKRRADHAMPQHTINEQLVIHAKSGKRVLRLKGGDPFIFGRGGEEIDTLADHGVSFQIVPGITAAAGCASYAGIPLTHRDHAQACIFVTGHLKDNTVDLNWTALVQPQQTVVIYMGLLGLPTICQQLIAHGMHSDTPIALVAQGTTRNQFVLTGTLSSMPSQVQHKAIKPPTLIIIGDVVRLRERLAWFDAAGADATIEN